MHEQLLAVQAMQDYIAAHPADSITLGDLAGISHYSPWHAYRLFRLYTGVTPSDYIRRVRLSQSAMRIKRSGARLIDAAYDAGFDSLDGYIRAFHREFGCTPGDYARHPTPIALFIPYDVKYRLPRVKEDDNMNQLQNVFIQTIRKPARKAIIKRGIKAEHYMDYCSEVGCDVWGLLSSMDSLGGEPVCLWLPDAYRVPGTSAYVQGVEVALDDTQPVPAGFDVIELPECDYLQFTGEPFAEEDFEQAIHALWQAMAKFDPARISCEWNDTQPRIQLEPRGERGYIELRAITKR